MATPHAMKKPGDRKNLPPFAHSTNRDSQAWTTAGAAVGFVQEVDEHASSEAHGQGTEGELHASSQPNPSTLQDLGQGHVSEGVIQSSENVQRKLQKQRSVVARKQVHYPSDIRPVKVYSRSSVEHASSEAHGQGTEGELHASPQPNPSTLQDLEQGHVSEGVIQSSENVQGNLQKQRPVVARKQVCYPSDVRPVKVYPRSNVEQDPDIERLRSAAAIIHPILNNPIITNSNPRGPRKQKWKAVIKRNLWWFIPLNIIISIGFILYFKYQDDIAKGTDSVRQWLAERAVWSWSVPTAILILLSCPPFFLIPLASEIVQFLVGLTYPLWIAIGVAALSTLVGDGALLLVAPPIFAKALGPSLTIFNHSSLIFKYAASDWVWKRCEKRSNWASIARVSQEAGIRGVLMIRFSIVPPSLANPIFATTGMSIWLYTATIVISLPKQIVLVILGFPSTKDDKGVMAAKGISVTGFIIITIWGTLWLRGKLRLAKDAIQAERNEELSDEIRKQVRLAAEQLEKDIP